MLTITPEVSKQRTERSYITITPTSCRETRRLGGAQSCSPLLDQCGRWLLKGVLGEADRPGVATPSNRAAILTPSPVRSPSTPRRRRPTGRRRELDATLYRHARIAFDHAVLHFDRAAHRIDHGTKLNDRAITRALDDAAVIHSEGGIDEIATEAPQAASVRSSSAAASRL